MKFVLDTNVFVYSMMRDERRHSMATSLVARSVGADCVLPLQVIGEFLNVIRRKVPDAFEDACAYAGRLRELLPVVETAATDLFAGAALSQRHRLQFWDAVLCQVARRGGAQLLLTEDMQDHREICGLMILNPFEERNDALVGQLLTAKKD